MTSIRSNSANVVSSAKDELQFKEQTQQAKGATAATEAPVPTAMADVTTASGEAGRRYTGGITEQAPAYNVSARAVTSGASIADLSTVSLSDSRSSAVDGDTGLGVVVTSGAAAPASTPKSRATQPDSSTSATGKASKAPLATKNAALTVASSATPTSTTTTAASTASNSAALNARYTQVNDAWLVIQKAMVEETSSLADLRAQLKSGWETLRTTCQELVKAQESLEKVKVGKHGRGRDEQAKWRNTINELKKDVKALTESLNGMQKNLDKGVANVKALSEEAKKLSEESDKLKQEAEAGRADGSVDKATYASIQKLATNIASDKNFANADKTIADYTALSAANTFDPNVLYLACTWNEGATLDGTTLTAQAWQSEQRYRRGGFSSLGLMTGVVGLNDRGGSTGVSSGGYGEGTYDVSGFGNNAMAFMDYLDSYERAVDIGSDTIGIADKRYKGRITT